MNWLKDKLSLQPSLNGIWLSSGSHVAAELAAVSGYDWALLDMEHGLGCLDAILRQIEALTHTGCVPVVRVPSDTSEAIARVLDYGAAGVMAPMIETAEQAAAFVRAMRYPPAGTRGMTRSSRACRYGLDFKDYFQKANGSLAILVQIETARAVEQADAIAATDGVDVLFIGHSDLSLNLGCFEQLDAPAMKAAEAAVLAACARHGKRAGMLLKAGMPIEPYRQKGFSVIALGSDIGCLKKGFETLHAAGASSARSPSGPSPEAHLTRLSPEDARAFERDTLRRVADLALLPPRLNTSPLPDYDYEKLAYGMTIGIARTPKGRLWAAWVAGEDGPKAFMLAATSDDDGQTWSKPRLVIDGNTTPMPIPRSVIVGNLWTDPLGRLWFFFDQTMNHFDGRGGLWAARCDNPDAETPAWSEPRRLWHGSMLNKPIVLSTGEWLMAAQLLQNSGFGPFINLFPELDPLRGVNIFISTDAGESWECRGRVALPNPNWHEPMVVERRDGTLWMMARTRKGIVETVSADGGRTWSEPTYPESVRQPPARFHLRRLASGRILLVKHGDRVDAYAPSSNGRVKLSAWLSEDEGKSWKGGLILDDRAGVSYPDGFQAPDGRIYISYDCNRATEGEIFLARFTEDDILAGCLVSPASTLRHCIIRPLGLVRRTG